MLRHFPVGHERREVEGDVWSSGVLMDVIECKKHRESSLEIPGMGSPAPQRGLWRRPSGQRHDEFGISIAEDARER